MKFPRIFTLSVLLSLLAPAIAAGRPGLTVNAYGRGHVSLNGKWSAIPDLYDQGRRMEVYKTVRRRETQMSMNILSTPDVCGLMSLVTGIRRLPNSNTMREQYGMPDRLRRGQYPDDARCSTLQV